MSAIVNHAKSWRQSKKHKMQDLCKPEVSATVFCSEISKLFPSTAQSDSNCQGDGEATFMDTLLSTHGFILNKQDVGPMLTKIIAVLEHSVTVTSSNLTTIYRILITNKVEPSTNEFRLIRKLMSLVVKYEQKRSCDVGNILETTIQPLLDIFDEEVDQVEGWLFTASAIISRVLNQVIDLQDSKRPLYDRVSVTYSKFIFLIVQEYQKYAQHSSGVKFVRLMDDVLSKAPAFCIMMDLLENLQEMGRNALHWAAIIDSPVMLKSLITNTESSECMYQEDYSANVPLYYVRSIEVAVLLLHDADAVINVVNNDGDTVIMFKLKSMLHEIQMNDLHLNTIEVCKFICQHPSCNVAIVNHSGENAVLLAMKCFLMIVKSDQIPNAGRERYSHTRYDQVKAEFHALVTTLLAATASANLGFNWDIDELFVLLKKSRVYMLFEAVQKHNLLAGVTEEVVNAVSEDGAHILHDVFMANNVKAAEGLLKIPSINVNVKSPDDRNLLQLAVEIGSSQLIHAVSSHPTFDLSAMCGTSGYLLLQEVVKSKKDASLLKCIVDVPGIKPDETDENGLTALFHAFENSNWEHVAILCQTEGVNVNIFNRQKEFLPLELIRKFHEVVLDRMFECRSDLDLDVNSLTEQGNSLLYYAAKRRNVVIVQHLLRFKCLDINHKNSTGLTALQTGTLDLLSLKECTKREIQLQIVSLLLGDKRVSVHDKDTDGNALIHIMCTLAMDETENKQLFLKLLSHQHVDVNVLNSSGKSPLYITVEQNNETAVTMLLEHKDIDVNQKCKHGDTALALAVKNKSASLIHLLLAHPGTNVTAQDRRGQPVVFDAVHLLQPNCVREFLSHSSFDANITNTYNQDILDVFDALPQQKKDPKLKALIRHATVRVTESRSASLAHKEGCNVPQGSQIRSLLEQLRNEVQLTNAYQETDQSELLQRLSNFEDALNRLDQNLQRGAPVSSSAGMSRVHQEILLRNHVFLLEEIEPGDIIDHLLQDGIIDLDMHDAVEAERTRKARVTAIMKILPRRGPNAFDCFIKALYSSNQTHIADQLLK